MLKHHLIHPKLNEILGCAGHTSKVLIADANYPASSTLGPRAELVSLNLSPGVVSCEQVLAALVATVPIETANTMDYARTGPYGMQSDPPVWQQYRRIFADADLEVQLEPLERFEFYKTVNSPDHVLTIQTGDQHLYANLLLTIGVRFPS